MQTSLRMTLNFKGNIHFSFEDNVSKKDNIKQPDIAVVFTWTNVAPRCGFLLELHLWREQMMVTTVQQGNNSSIWKYFTMCRLFLRYGIELAWGSATLLPLSTTQKTQQNTVTDDSQTFSSVCIVLVWVLWIQHHALKSMEKKLSSCWNTSLFLTTPRTVNKLKKKKKKKETAGQGEVSSYLRGRILSAVDSFLQHEGRGTYRVFLGQLRWIRLEIFRAVVTIGTNSLTVQHCWLYTLYWLCSFEWMLRRTLDMQTCWTMVQKKASTTLSC